MISAPYTPTNVLNVPLALDPTATFFTRSAAFNSIKVTDTRAGDLPWDLKAKSSALTFSGNSDNGENVGLPGLVVDTTATTTVSTAAGNLTVTNAPAASPPIAPADPGTAGLGGTQHTPVHANAGLGTITYKGRLTINAHPTCRPAPTPERSPSPSRDEAPPAPPPVVAPPRGRDGKWLPSRPFVDATKTWPRASEASRERVDMCRSA